MRSLILDDVRGVSRGTTSLLVCMCLAVLLAQVDTSVVNLAMRSVGHDLSAGVVGLQWVLDAYNLAYAALLLSGGLLSDLYGRRRLFLIGAAIFTVGSVGCAAAPTISVLIGARAMTGTGSALLLPASLSIIRVAWPNQQARNRALGIWAACNGLAFVVGPTIGGGLVDQFGWRSVFLIAVPLGSAAVALAARVVPESRDLSGRRLDVAGQIWGAVALSCLAFAGIEASHDHVAAAAAFAAAIGALFAFLSVERGHGEAAMLPLALFRRPHFTGVLIATTGMTFGMYGLLFLVPLVWQSPGSSPEAGSSAAVAGLGLVPMAVVFFALSNFSGRLAERVGARTMIGGGVAIIGLGLLVVACGDAARPLWLSEIGMVLAGIGMGLATGPLYGEAVAAVPSERSGSASSLINVARMIGATLGVAVLGAAFAIGGLRAAMVAGAVVQLAGAATAWRALR